MKDPTVELRSYEVIAAELLDHPKWISELELFPELTGVEGSLVVDLTHIPTALRLKAFVLDLYPEPEWRVDSYRVNHHYVLEIWKIRPFSLGSTLNKNLPKNSRISLALRYTGYRHVGHLLAQVVLDTWAKQEASP